MPRCQGSWAVAVTKGDVFMVRKSKQGTGHVFVRVIERTATVFVFVALKVAGKNVF